MGSAMTRWLARGRGVAATAAIAHAPPFAVVGLFALAYIPCLLFDDKAHKISFGGPVPILASLVPMTEHLLGPSAAMAFIALAVTRNRRRSLQRSATWLATRNWLEILLVRIPLTATLEAGIAFFYLEFKINIARLQPYSWDHFFAQADRLLFLGKDPWALTHWLVPGAEWTQIFDLFYRLWFILMHIVLFGAGMLPMCNRLRLTFLTAYGLIWLVGGTLVAILFASAGPVYMERLTGDATFAPLLAQLEDQAAVTEIYALDVQQTLWDGYTIPGATPYGISAFPSIHVGMAVVLACFGFAVSRTLGWLLSVFAFVIFAGSIHLGWHYASDGIAGAALAVLLWRLSDRMAKWWLTVTKRGARQEPFDAAAPCEGRPRAA